MTSSKPLLPEHHYSAHRICPCEEDTCKFPIPGNLAQAGTGSSGGLLILSDLHSESPCRIYRNENVNFFRRKTVIPECR
jgi:hypothetical protein